MKKKKNIIKTIKILFIGLLGILLLWILINRFDIPEIKTEYDGKTAIDYFGKPDYSRANGYYRLFTLGEPEDVDVESEEIYQKYRAYLEPGHPEAKTIKFSKKNHLIETLRKARREYKYDKRLWRDQYFGDSKSWIKKIKMDKREIQKMEELIKIFLERYHRLLYSEKLEDICRHKAFLERDRYGYSSVDTQHPVPNFFAWIKIAPYYNLVQVLKCIEGNWEEGFKNLLRHLTFLRKSLKIQRLNTVKLINQIIMEMTIQVINMMMNEKSCPREFIKEILSQPDLIYQEYGRKDGLITEYIFSTDGQHILNGLYVNTPFNFSQWFYQKNRTCRNYLDYFNKLLYFDRTLPYQLKEDPKDFKYSFKTGLWWLKNPVGKSFLEKSINPRAGNFQRYFIIPFQLKAGFEMLKIGAELRLKYSGKMSGSDTLKSLNTFQTYKDPFSGKPYKWNAKKELLYSIGPDKTDHNGHFTVYDYNNTDFPLPVILYVQSEEK